MDITSLACNDHFVDRMKTTAALVMIVLYLAAALTLTFADAVAGEEAGRGRNGRLRKGTCTYDVCSEGEGGG